MSNLAIQYVSPDRLRPYPGNARTHSRKQIKLIADSIKEFHSKEAMQTDAMKDLDGIIRDAIKLKFIDRPLTKEQLAELIQIPPR